MNNLTDDIKDTVLSQNEYLLFYFTASWCGPCQIIKPDIIRLADGLTTKNIKFYMIDIDDNDELTSLYNIQSVPTFILIKNKEKIGESSGADILNVANLIKPYC